MEKKQQKMTSCMRPGAVREMGRVVNRALYSSVHNFQQIVGLFCFKNGLYRFLGRIC